MVVYRGYIMDYSPVFDGQTTMFHHFSLLNHHVPPFFTVKPHFSAILHGETTIFPPFSMVKPSFSHHF